MSYLTQSKIAANQAMNERVIQCAVGEQISDGQNWAYQHQREWAAAPGWDDAWEYALNVHSSDQNYDPGTDEAVITDGMILSQVQAMNPPPEEEPT
jgi:hypothetical protein